MNLQVKTMTRKQTFMIGLLLAAVTLGLLVSPPQPAKAQSDRSWDWTRWDVQIFNVDTRNNLFHVTETHIIKVTVGSFAGGDRSVGLDRVVGIENVSIRDGSIPLVLRPGTSESSCPTTPGIFCVFTNANAEREIYYNFVARTYAGQTRTITIDYDVRGALRSYPEGDQLWWSPLASSRDFLVLASRVVVTMPESRTLLADNNTSSNWKRTVQKNTVVFDSIGVIGNNDLAEISVTYAHDPAMAAAPWQASFDQLVKLKPFFSIGLLALAVLFGLGGPLWVFIRYSTKGRDPRPVVVPEYLTEPPSDLPPGVVGTLIDKRADMSDIIATMMDLARRGYLMIQQEQHAGLFGHSYGFVFHRTDPAQVGATEPPRPLRGYEGIFLDGLFRGRPSVRLADLKNNFYKYVPSIKSQLYVENIAAGYFENSPETVRGAWIGAGLLCTILGGIIFFALLSNSGANLRNQISPLIALPFLGFAIYGVSMLLVAAFMPGRTALGSQENVKWRAFKHYLANINRYTNVQAATDQFEKYIAYAVAFGINTQWVHQFSNVLTSMPNWYYIDGYSHHHPYWSRSSPMGSSGNIFGGSGSGGLNDMNAGLSQGLNAMSSGLTSLLNSAGNVLSSSPSSSSSGGGGGHGGGGGSSGGGHAGGH